MHHYDIITDLASHDRSKEETSALAEGVDFTGDSLDGFTKVRRPLQLQHPSITWEGKIKDTFPGRTEASLFASSPRLTLESQFVFFRCDLKMGMNSLQDPLWLAVKKMVFCLPLHTHRKAEICFRYTETVAGSASEVY